jgi:poly(3-hydroxybutyrate) depolymerase
MKTNQTKPIGTSTFSARCSTNVLLTWLLFLAAFSTGFAQSTIQFSAPTYTVAESAGAVTLTVQRTGDTNTAVTVDYSTADGTATNGLKYTAVSGTLAFGSGETNQTIVVPILNNGFVEGTKTFKVILSNPTNAVLGTRTNATVSITDNDAGVAFVLASYSVAEEAGAAQIGVVRGDDGTLPVTVDLANTDVTATSRLDYVGITNTLSFGPTERLKLVTIPILNDGLKEANETFRVTLSNPTGGTLGSTKTTTITIVDNDPGLQFESATYSVAEDAGAVLINVTRGDDTNSAAAVNYATSDLTATNGVDYTGTTNTLSFAPGERVKLISVPILNDGITEPTKTFRVTLSNPSDGNLGPQTTATVTILDNDPGIGFELGSYSVWEGAGAANLIVLRGDDWNLGPITVDYTTSNLTATAGEDYQALSGTLEFQENETIKSLAIPIFRDGLVEGAETFRVTLSNATGGATLGRATTTVTIQDNYFTVVPPFNSMLGIRRDGDVNMLTWAGGGQLQRADRVEGPWQTLAAARSPCAVRSRLPASFYKVKHPRPVKLYVPSDYDPQTPMPLVILLHGHGADGQWEESYMNLRSLAEARGFLYCYPDSTGSLNGNMWNASFWNDADAAAPGLSNVDDVGYLRSVIGEVSRRFALDRKRVHLIGHSNGGFMSYRMACESADLIAGIASLAGTTTLPFGRCQPSGPVNILHIHGTADAEVHYEGGAWTIPDWPWNTFPYLSVMLSLQNWAGYNGASNPTTEAAPSLDLMLDVAGLDSVVTRYTTFPPGGAVELWTINGGVHVPTLSSQFSPRVIDWLLVHPKP